MMRSLFIALATFWVAIAMAQTAPLEQRRQLVEQKIKLLELLVGSPAAKAAAANHKGDGPPLAERGRLAIEQARQAMGEGRDEQAMQLLDEALKSSTAESRRLQSGTALSESAQRQAYRNLQEQVATYRVAVADLAKDAKTAPAAKGLLTRIDTMAAEGQKHESQGNLGEANRLLADAYKLAVGELARLRAGQEVVMSLRFDSPAEEYAYEEKRFESGEMMVGMMIAEGRAAGDRQAMVEGLAEEARRLQAEASALAKSGRHKDAIGLMEQATSKMNRALQTMGVPVF